MIIKSALAVSFLVATPIAVVSSASPSPQDPGKPVLRDTGATGAGTEQTAPGKTATENGELERLRRDVQRLRSELRHEQQRVEQVQERLEGALDQLDEALDMLVEEPDRERHRHNNCSPSRSNLISRHQWMHTRGHESHAEQVVDRIASACNHDANRLNRLAWNLMTEEESVGRFDATALAITDRIERDVEADELPHQIVDTIALSNFLGHRFERAVELERAALEGADRGEYRRRLRTYEAALAAVRADAPPAEEPAPDVAHAPHEVAAVTEADDEE